MTKFLWHFAPFLVLVACFGWPALPALADQNDPDFAVQGEYVGDQIGMQVVARGDGEFDLVIFEGGLPGAGATATEPRRIEGDADIVADLAESRQLTKTIRKSPTLGAKPPAGATVLFDGTAESLEKNWQNGKLTETNLLAQGATTRKTFTDYSLHAEFRTPWMPNAQGQARGNSGIYHQGRYETQVLDSFGLEGRDNEAGGIYEISSPSINACLPPLSWQTYDVDFTAARYDEAGAKVVDARMTVRLNGIVVQSDVSVPRATRASKLGEGSTPGPIDLQDHGNPVVYRNIWILPRDTEKESRRPIIPGFERFFASSPTPQSDGGELLINSLACDACHSRSEASMLPRQLGPDLSDVVSRVRCDALVRMIENPHEAKPGTTMPDPWPGLSDDERKQRAAAIASYLIVEGKGKLIDRAASQQMSDRGATLYHTVGCVACHAIRDQNQFMNSGTRPSTSTSTSVPLGDLSHKYSLVSLARFLQNPHAVRPGLRMPALTGSTDEAFAIAAYLTGDVTVRAGGAKLARRVYRGQWERLPDFDSLVPIATDTVTHLQIDDIKPENNFGVVFEAELPIASAGEYRFRLTSDDGSAFEIAGNRLENDFIHPDQTREATYALDAGIYPIRIEYFDGGGQINVKLEMEDPNFGTSDISNLIADPDNVDPNFVENQFIADERLVDQGRRWFASAGCKNCHKFTDADEASLAALSLDQLKLGRGCLAETVKSPAVDYELNVVQRAAIEAAIASRRTGDEPDDSAHIHLTMAALNCYACHARGKIGGPELARDATFQTTMPEMGLEGRLPPPLDGVGDKLNDTYFSSAIQNGGNLRDYMKTRMPAFQYEPLRAFHRAINASDRRDEMQTAEHSDSHDEILAAGRQSVGDKGLACIKCHSFGGDKGGGLGAIDMLEMTNRLRIEWFQRYLQDPTLYRPGTRMPNSFVDGKSALTSLYDGDPILQIDAMWQYLRQGKQAKEPEGLKQGAIVLTADEKPRIYRNFFSGMSARGIAVGYPSGSNLIWDAESMSLARAWHNSFVDASLHWVGRGQGRQEPLGDAVIQIETSTPIAQLDSIDAAWPMEPGRDRGFRFKGYRLDSDGNPTFEYSIGQTTITDAPLATTEQPRGFVRRITIDRTQSDSDSVLVWQPVAGTFTKSDRGYVVNDRFDMTVDGVELQTVGSGDHQSLRASIPPRVITTITQTIRW